MTDEQPRLTALPSFNDAARAVEAVIGGQSAPEPALAKLEAFDREFHLIVGIFHSEVRYQPDTELLRQETPKALEAFEAIHTYLPELRSALEREDADLCGRLLRRMTRRVDQMMASLARLKEEESQREVLSPSPFINELLRNSYAYMEGKLSRGLLQERLTSVMTHLQGFLAGLEQARPDPKETALLAERKPEMDEALDLQLEALHEIEHHLQQTQADPQELREPLAILQRTTQSLYELTQALAQAMLAEEGIHCPRCGASNDRQARYCSRCNAVIPTFTTEAVGANPQVDLHEGGGAPGDGQLPPLMRKLLDAVEGAARGTASAEDLKSELEAARSRLNAIRKGLDQLEDPAEDTPPEQRQVFEDSYAGIQEGLDRFEEGLAVAEEYFGHSDARVLYNALQLLTPAAEQLAGLQARGTAWLAQARSGG